MELSGGDQDQAKWKSSTSNQPKPSLSGALEWLCNEVLQRQFGIDYVKVAHFKAAADDELQSQVRWAYNQNEDGQNKQDEEKNWQLLQVEEVVVKALLNLLSDLLEIEANGSATDQRQRQRRWQNQKPNDEIDVQFIDFVLSTEFDAMAPGWFIRKFGDESDFDVNDKNDTQTKSQTLIVLIWWVMDGIDLFQRFRNRKRRELQMEFGLLGGLGLDSYENQKQSQFQQSPTLQQVCCSNSILDASALVSQQQSSNQSLHQATQSQSSTDTEENLFGRLDSFIVQSRNQQSQSISNQKKQQWQSPSLICNQIMQLHNKCRFSHHHCEELERQRLQLLLDIKSEFSDPMLAGQNREKDKVQLTWYEISVLMDAGWLDYQLQLLDLEMQLLDIAQYEAVVWDFFAEQLLESESENQNWEEQRNNDDIHKRGSEELHRKNLHFEQTEDIKDQPQHQQQIINKQNNNHLTKILYWALQNVDHSKDLASRILKEGDPAIFSHSLTQAYQLCCGCDGHGSATASTSSKQKQNQTQITFSKWMKQTWEGYKKEISLKKASVDKGRLKLAAEFLEGFLVTPDQLSLVDQDLEVEQLQNDNKVEAEAPSNFINQQFFQMKNFDLDNSASAMQKQLLGFVEDVQREYKLSLQEADEGQRDVSELLERLLRQICISQDPVKTRNRGREDFSDQDLLRLRARNQ